MKCALTIAGSDSSGGAGVQADIKTMMANGVFATSAITALTAQNTCGVTGIMNVTPDFLAQQIDAVFSDIRPDAVKIGMVSESALIHVIADKLDQWRPAYVVADPVMVATSGARLISEDAVSTLVAELLPRATVITPNRPEAEVLADMSIDTEQDMEAAARAIGDRLGCAVLVKGGHSLADASDVLYRDGGFRWYRGARIDTRHGLHALQRDRVQPGQGLHAGRVRLAREGLHLGRARRDAGSGPRLRSHEPRL